MNISKRRVIKIMNEFNRTTKNIVLVLLSMFLVFLVLGYFFRDISFLNGAFGAVTFKVYTFGLILGIGFSIIKVFLIRFTIKKTLVRSPNKAQITSLGHYLFRYFLTGFILYISIVNDNIDFFATMIGVILLQPASYLTGMILKKGGGENANYISTIERELDI